jgi:hypothetical protein
MRRLLHAAGMIIVAISSTGCLVTDVGALSTNITTKVLAATKVIENQTHADLYRRIGRSLDLFAPLIRYRMADPPRWRTRWPDGLIENAQQIADALNSGDPGWARYRAITIPIRAVGEDFATYGNLSADQQADLRRRLGVVQAMDGVIRASIDLEGRVRGQRNPYQAALEALESIITLPAGTTQVAGQVAAAIAMHNRTTQTIGHMHAAITDLAALQSLQQREASTPGVTFAIETAAVAQTAAETTLHFDDALATWELH